MKSPAPPKKVIRARPAKKSDKRSRRVDPSGRRELLYYGLHMCTSLSLQRRQDVIRVYCTELTARAFGPLLRWCAQHKKAYHLVTEAELERITGSVHHEGLAILAYVMDVWGEEELFTALQQRAVPLVWIDGVQNPHNIGTIMRVMAHFAWPFLLGGPDLPQLSAAAARMSEGGAEWVRLVRCQSWQPCIQRLREHGYRLMGTSSHASHSLYTQPLPERVVFVLGSEVHGMSQEMAGLLDETLKIPGSGQVESLNVAVASGLLLGEYTRTHGLRR